MPLQGVRFVVTAEAAVMEELSAQTQMEYHIQAAVLGLKSFVVMLVSTVELK
jgi:hypothetical protein